MDKKTRNQQKMELLSTGSDEGNLDLVEKGTPIGSKTGKFGIWLGKEKGIYDTRNDLNDLTGKEWIQRTKSVWISERCTEDKEAFKHPAPFLIKDIRRLITLFTKKGMLILDPFVGSGTSLISAALEKRNGIGFDLNPDYIDLAINRITDCCGSKGNLTLFDLNRFENESIDFIPEFRLVENLRTKRDEFWKNIKNSGNNNIVEIDSSTKQAIMLGDAYEIIDEIPVIDYCITSPPYHNILKNTGLGVRHDGSQTRQGVEFYSNDPKDLGNQPNYEEFILGLSKIFKKIYKKIRGNKYCSIIISDFTVNKVETNVHGDVIKMMIGIGYEFVGTIVLLQDSKVLYPFGYPYQFKINHVHQYILNFRKRE